MDDTTRILRGQMRVDSVPIDTRNSPEGYFYDQPVLTRTGVFEYENSDGTKHYELRRPEDVFDPASLASYEGKPIIITHDAHYITKGNALDNEVGTVLTAGYQDGDTVRAKIVLHDPDSVKASGYRDLSLGYSQDLVFKPGVWEGIPYDAIQTNIRVNHLALVAVARAGGVARLNMDGTTNTLKGATTMDENKTATGAVSTCDGDDSAAMEAAIKAGIEAYKAAQAAASAAPAVATTDEGEEQPAAAVPAATTEEPNKKNADEGGANEGVPPAQDGEQKKDPPAPPAAPAVSADEGEGGEDVVGGIAARRDGYADEQAKADVNTLLALLGNPAAPAATQQPAAPYATDEDDTEKPATESTMNHDSASIDKIVTQRLEACRIADRLSLDGVERMGIRDAKKAIVAAVMPNMRLDGKSDSYIDASYDIAKGVAMRRKTTDDQRQQINALFNTDGAETTKAKDPEAHRKDMIDRQLAKD